MPFLTDEDRLPLQVYSREWDFDTGGKDHMYERIAASLHIDRAKIQDVYPCTPMQEALISLSTAGSGAYIKQIVLSLASDIDMNRFRSAIEDMAETTALLRTWIVQCDGAGFVQAVLQGPIQWDHANSLERHLEEAMTGKWGIGERLVRYTIVNNENTPRWFVWSIHHALYDGWSFHAMVEMVTNMYNGCSIGKVPQYKDFVRHLLMKNSKADKAYWKSALAGAQDKNFPRLPTIFYMPVVDAMMEQRCPPLPKITGVSRTAQLQAAWAIVQSRFQDFNSPVFGTIVSGRDEPMSGVKELIGPTIAIVPVRVDVNIHGNELVGAYLTRVQAQIAKRKPVDHLGLQNISRVSHDAKQACGFQTLLVVQPGEESHVVTNALGVWRRVDKDVGRSSYALTIQCFLNREEIKMTAAFDASILETWLVKRMLAYFSFVTQELARADESHTLAQIVEKAPPGDINDIWNWNANIPTSTKECVHNLVSEVVERQPQELAVCAWDGTLTYRQLDELATQLACRLIRQLGTELKGLVVPLCFEKSVWMPVAMLGVMKAGGASVALDTTLPMGRLKSIVSGLTGLKLIVASRESIKVAEGLGGSETMVVIADEHQALNLGFSASAKPHLLPSTDPSDVLMVLFTSGSTGSPKGTIITHSSFATAISHHGKVFGIGPGERVYDFASYSFDIAWFNALQSLSHGACLCIPSEHERKNDLEGSILRFNATIIFITPSVARLLKVHNLPCIRCIALGGEPQKWSDFQSWPAHVRKLSVYGPAECTVVSAAMDAEILRRGDMVIGHGLACANWILTNTPSPTLAPIGTVGELWLEGPLVGQGYINDDSRTARSFIKNPDWLLHGDGTRHPGRHGRLYRTGDLVRYNADGTLLFVGRKDTQVKIRGQRVELGEVEYHIRRALDNNYPSASRSVVIAETIRPEGTDNSTLVAFLCAEGPESKTGEFSSDCSVPEGETQDLVARLGENLSEIVPPYMIPNAFIPLTHIPTTSNGKIDRRKLREIGQMVYQEHLFIQGQHGITPPCNDVEKTLLEIWAEVLNLSTATLSTTMSFTRIGGDSITAMQVVSRCRANNLSVTVREILRGQTIQNVAAMCTSALPNLPLLEERESGDISWDPSPIQRMFFEFYPDGLNHFNQGFLLKLKQPLSGYTIQWAMEKLMERHPMLQARFQKNAASEWEQFISNDMFQVAFQEHYISLQEDIRGIIHRRQASLDILNGPVFAADLFNLEDESQRLFLVAHHLVVDLVSWRIIWHELELLVRKETLLSLPTTSFKTWCRLQKAESQALSLNEALPISIKPPNLEYWGISFKENLQGGSIQYTRTLDIEVTKRLLGTSNSAFKTDCTDILIGVLANSFQKIFSDRDPPSIFLEGHGREPLDGFEIDLSETVGWFTTLHPIHIPIHAGESTITSIKSAKDIRRKVPGKGRPYFSCRYDTIQGRTAWKSHSFPELTLNFTGVYQQLERPGGIFQIDNETHTAARSLSTSSNAQRFGYIEVIVNVTNGCMNISFHVHQKMQHQARLEEWIHLFAQELQSSAYSLASMQAYFTPGDFPLLKMSYDELDSLFINDLSGMGVSPDVVKDIYPCSPLQEGILMAIQKGAATYATFFIWKCEAGSGEEISSVSLGMAWRAVVARHTVLSTIFVQNSYRGDFVQIQLHTRPSKVVYINSQEKCPMDLLKEHRPSHFAIGEPAHIFTVCHSSSGDVACRLDISHTLIDAASISIIAHDIMRSYEHATFPQAAQFHELIKHLSVSPKSKDVAYWVKFLRGVKRCEFPTRHTPSDSQKLPEGDYGRILIPSTSTTQLHAYCQSQGITRSVFLQVAWALVLSYYTGCRDVCFGYMASCRDVPINGIENMVGPLINLLISRISLDGVREDVFSTTAQQSIQHLSFQNASFAEIQHELGISSQRLFNTAITLRESRKYERYTEGRFYLREIETEDPDEFDLTLTAELDGSDTAIKVNYRKSAMGDSVARELSIVVCNAIAFLLDYPLDTKYSGDISHSQCNAGNERTLYDAFFFYMTGVCEYECIAFWKDRFTGCAAPQFPRLPFGTYIPKSRSILNHEIRHPIPDLRPPQLLATIQTAWAVLIGTYTNSNDIVFGALSVDSWPGLGQNFNGGSPLSIKQTVIPIRITLNWDGHIDETVKDVERKVTSALHLGKIHMWFIERLSDETKRACQFQTVLAINPPNTGRPKSNVSSQFSSTVPSSGKQEPVFEVESTHGSKMYDYALVVECHTTGHGIELCLLFDPTVLEKSQVTRIAYQMEHILLQLLERNSTISLRNINTINEYDLCDIWSRNSIIPTSSQDTCVHKLFIAVAQKFPSALAVCAWDGEITYKQLDDQSTGLAYRLVELGLKMGDIVSLCLEKSIWTPVAMLGVMKAGGVSVNMDVTQPEERLQAIVSQANPRFIVSSIRNVALATRLCQCPIIQIGDELPRCPIPYHPLPSVGPAHNLYIVFTSGTTGVPKGVIISHGNFCSAIKHQKALGFTCTSRVYDFASYAFDVSWSNALHTLTAGGCLCIPSEEDRKQNLSGSIRAFKANYVDLTPTVAQLLDPADIPSLTTLNLGGEALLPGTFDNWPPHIRIINAYGPAECTVVSTYTEVSAGKQDHGIGFALGTVTWVVSLDGSELAAVGAEGELWIEGPLVGQGYLNNPSQTMSCFIQDPPWLLRGCLGHPGRQGRLYKTGDLVCYNIDGSLTFLGRKDTQVKIHGQRVELGDIEHCVVKALSPDFSSLGGVVVAETIRTQGSDSPTLIAFVSPGPSMPVSVTQKALADIDTKLVEAVPSHMIPSAFITLADMPRTATGKVNRRLLRDEYSLLTWDRIIALGSKSQQRGYPQPSTSQERQMQSLWASLLHLDTYDIGVNDNFFQLGGDSIHAMKLVGLARQHDLSLTVADIFMNPRLGDLAGILKADNSSMKKTIAPFSLLQPGINIQETVQKATSMCQTTPGDIEDIFACTPLQEGLLAITAQRPMDYIAQFTYTLPSNIKVESFTEAWAQVISASPILRTRIVELPAVGLSQVILRSRPSWFYASDLKLYLEVDGQQSMKLGEPLSRFCLIRELGSTHFVWTIHHALYDGWTIPLLLNSVDQAYHGRSITPWTPFPVFVHFINHVDQEARSNFWQQQFSGLKAVQFPPLPSPDFLPSPDHVIDYKIAGIGWSGKSFTPSTMIRAVWAILIAQYTNVQEALFGAVVSGRQAAVRDVEHIMGPTIATVPVRIGINWGAPLQNLLSTIQKQATEMISFEQTGLQNIQHISDGAKRGCQFQSLLLVKTDTENRKTSESSLFSQRLSSKDTVDTFSTYSLMLECQVIDQSLVLHWTFDSSIIQYRTVKRLIQQFEYLLRQVSRQDSGSSLVSSLETITGHDLQDIWEWNKIPPALVNGSLATEPPPKYYRKYYKEYWCISPDTPKVYWIIDINKNELAAIGAVGELWLEVPPANETLMTPERNADAEFLDDPVWLLRGASVDLPGRRGRIYRTRDLVRYNEDGSLSFLGRREIQVDQQDMLIPPSNSWDELISVPQKRGTPQTHLQKQLQSLWSRILNIPMDAISLDDHFMRLGGDSVKAMRLAAIAQSEGISLSVANILRHPTLGGLSETIQASVFPDNQLVRPFSLLGDMEKNSILQKVKTLLKTEKIHDIFPCTPLQQGLLALAVKHDGACIARYAYELQNNVDICNFTRSWDKVVEMLPILRTRFVSLPSKGVFQVITDHRNTWVSGSNILTYIQEDKARSMAFGEPLSRTGLVQDRRSGKNFFVWTIHHAIYDGWSISLILDHLQAVYKARSAEGYHTRLNEPPVHFQAFIKYVTELDHEYADRFWAEQFDGLEALPFPTLSSPAYCPSADKQVKFRVHLPWTNTNFTAPTIIQAAWSIISATYCGINDTITGLLVSGRQAAVSQIDKIVAPTIATVPMRIVVDWNFPLRDLLQKVQRWAADIIAFEQTGLQHIKQINEDTRRACQFQTILVIQPKDMEHNKNSLFSWDGKETEYPAEAVVNFSEYVLTLECQLEQQGMHVLANFDSAVIDEVQMTRILRQFEHIIRQMLSIDMQSKQLKQIHMLNAYDSSDIWKWNSNFSSPSESCLHDLVVEVSSDQPEALAVNSWDGELTYKQLNDFSTELASFLCEQGVGAEVLVPICLEKSMWMAVAILAVLKSGGAFVPIDIFQAPDRAKLIMDEIQPIVVVTSRKYGDFVQKCGYSTIYAADLHTQTGIHIDNHIPCCSLKSAAYVIFTSGTTGKPKGVVVEHQAASTSILAHGMKLGFCRQSRVLQFASHSFDASIMEFLTTLVYGGCVCIPSDESRLLNLTENINSMGINTLFLTPSVAQILQPRTLPSLQTLIIGGETVPTSVVEKWKNVPKLINGYGPTECVVFCVMHDLKAKQVSPQTIGKAVGSLSWVVDPENHHELVPVGAVGELLVEGSILSRGYLNDPTLTAISFIENPSWLLQGHGEYPGRRGRLYKTGDLVKYNPDGTLRYIGRVDTQVKIRGQRVELGEVESCVRRIWCNTSLENGGNLQQDALIVAEIITPQCSSQQALVAFIYPGKLHSQSRQQCSAAVGEAVAGFKSRLKTHLPAHMIPSAFIPVDEMPTTVNGKVDRKRLRELGKSLNRLYLASLDSESFSLKRLPLSQTERTIQRVWAQVLNFTGQIGLDDSFFSLGGDSISAMQVCTALKQHGLTISLRNIMQKDTISKLTSCLEEAESSSLIPISRKEPGSRFSLSPIQQFHFDTRPSGPDLLDLPFYLRLAKYTSSQMLRNTLEEIVKRHPMLRTRFSSDSMGKMTQYISQDVGGSLHFECYHGTDDMQKKALISRCRAAINIERGPLFVAALFEDVGQQTLFITAHHLVIDFVSWRIIFEDIENLLSLQPLTTPSSISFMEWCLLQNKYALTHLEPSVVLHSMPKYPSLDYWGLKDQQNGKEIYARRQFFLDTQTSKAIIGSCSDKLQVRPHELMMAALSYSFTQVFQDRDLPPIFTEGHGRFGWGDENLDVSQTVGWFTIIFPVPLDMREGDELLDFIIKTKESMRGIPCCGWSYFSSKYLNPRGRQAFYNDPIEINFNFLGHFQQLERESSLIEAIPLPSDCKPAEMPSINTVGVFDITIIIERGQIEVDFKYNNEVKHGDRVVKWIETYQSSILDIVKDMG
ncbi:uncharacterized protein ARB_02149 [Trichophyton benhamiae CBS 112371]|uniref:Carrier domain-containing protein n=1 Tax=Arthroderma benhamiae (strain ATCC MYA-4681 / CBS 112371) TaxID=663331 RepID=D4B120_ARTBC|nr:uncharacterized protein ARB_02149 [Trichophyton benhamiae CBS 112371]EFE30955.1 hypothetical protein ARB_02149 [Trichophyton benhamiae CBS 112371]